MMPRPIHIELAMESKSSLSGMLSLLDEKIFPAKWSAESWDAEINNELNFQYLFYIDSAINGFAAFSQMANDIEIRKFGILPENRNMGYGRTILNNLLNRFTDKPWSRIFLEVSSENKAAIRLYESVNFNRISTRKKYYKDTTDAFLYERMINYTSL